MAQGRRNKAGMPPNAGNEFAIPPYRILRTNRKTVAIEIDKNLSLLVRAPLHYSGAEIARLVSSRADWIEKHMEIARQRARRLEGNPAAELTQHQIDALYDRARQELPRRVKHFGALMGVMPTHINVTYAKTRYGSCSSKDSISFSYLLMLKPDDLIDYVVVHELAHIRHKNHSPAFYAFIEQFMPDHKERRAQLLLPLQNDEK